MGYIERLTSKGEARGIEKRVKEYAPGSYFVLVLCERNDISPMGWSRTKANPFVRDFNLRHVIPLNLSETMTAEEILERVKKEPEVKDCPLQEDHADLFIFIVDTTYLPPGATVQKMEIPEEWSE